MAEPTVPPRLAGPADRPGTPSWQAAEVELSVALFHPQQLRIRGSGQQRLGLPGLPEVGFTADRFDITVPLEPGVAADHGDLAVAGLRAALPTDTPLRHDTPPAHHAAARIAAGIPPRTPTRTSA